MTSNVLQLADFHEAEMLQFARDWLAAMRDSQHFFGGDPFNTDTMHADVRRLLKFLADMHERNAAPGSSILPSPGPRMQSRRSRT